MPDADFEEFYQATYRGLVGQLYALTGDLGEAQEAAQEAYLRAWSRWRQISAYDEPGAWVRRVGYRIAVSRWRHARTAATFWRRQPPPAPHPPPDGHTVALVAALRQIPATHRRAVVLHHLAGLPVAEIAAEEGVAVGTVKSWLSRGRERLATLLADEAPNGTEVDRHA